MVILRYFAKEIFVTMTSITVILLLVVLSTHSATNLGRIVSGHIPPISLFKLTMIELPMLIGFLLPISFYLALVVTYSRLYSDNEMTVLHACGYGPKQLLGHSFIIAGIMFFLLLIITLWISPTAAIERTKLLNTHGIQILIKTIISGRFHDVSNGQQVYYVTSMNYDHTIGHHVFLARQIQKKSHVQWNVLWANQAHIEVEPSTHENYITLENGTAYEGQPGQADYQIAKFGRYKTRLPPSKVKIENDIRTFSTSSLLPINNTNLKKAAELQWRLSIPLMVLTLTLIGFSLSKSSPREGKYAKLLPAILLLFLYVNFVLIARQWFALGKSPPWLGIWWIHAIVALFGLLLIWRNHVKLS